MNKQTKLKYIIGSILVAITVLSGISATFHKDEPTTPQYNSKPTW